MYDLIILAITCLVCWMVCGNLFAMILYDVRKSDIAHGGNDVERYFYGG